MKEQIPAKNETRELEKELEIEAMHQIWQDIKPYSCNQWEAEPLNGNDERY